jgi:hypothetical protein
MTPKDKAKELIDKMYATQGPEYGITEDEAKQCALVAVDEVLNVIDNFEMIYWESVKQEIEKL